MHDRLDAIFKTIAVPRPRLGESRLSARTVTYDEVVFDRFWPHQFLLDEGAVDWVRAQGLDHSILGDRIGFRDVNHALAFKLRWG